MPEKKSAEIARNIRELYEKGNAALQKKNYEYAIAIYNQVLTQEPGFYDARAALRASQLAKAGSGGGFFRKVLGTASSSPQLAKAQILLRNNPREAINTCEQVLNSDPNNTAANKLLAEAAMALDYPNTAVLSLELAFKNAPRDRETALRLGEALGAAGQISRGEMILTEVRKAYPTDPEIDQMLKNLAAKKTLSEGGYDALSGGTGSYRDILKDKAQASTLEQESRTVKSEDVALDLINEYSERLQREPENKRLPRQIAELHVQRKEYDKALEFLNRINPTDGAMDPSLERVIGETKVKIFEQQLAALDPADPEFEAKRKSIEKERDEYRIGEARGRVERYPNDLQHRYDLGKLLYESGRIGEAIQEFQKAQVNPNRRVSSLYYLGQCFSRRNMHDLAVKSLQNALNEKQGFDEERKELIYALGLAFEKMGKAEDAINEFKKIYEVDIGYKDVAKRVDDHYGANG